MTLDTIAEIEATTSRTITGEIEEAGAGRAKLVTRAEKAMGHFRVQYPQESTESGDSNKPERVSGVTATWPVALSTLVTEDGLLRVEEAREIGEQLASGLLPPNASFPLRGHDDGSTMKR